MSFLSKIIERAGVNGFTNKPNPANDDAFLFEELATGKYYNITKAQLAAVLGGSQTLAQVLTNGSSTADTAITSNTGLGVLYVFDDRACLSFDDGLSGAGFIEFDPNRFRIKHSIKGEIEAPDVELRGSSSIVLTAPTIQVSQDATAGKELVTYDQWSAALPGTKTTEVFEVTGTTIALANAPTYAAVYKNGSRLNPTSVGAYVADYSLSGTTITLAEAAAGDLFLIENTH